MATSSGVDEHLAALPDKERAVLEQLRKTIKAAAPEATESIAYDMPAFRINGRFLVSYAAFKNHCSLFPASQAVLDKLGDELKPYYSGKGTLRFTTDDPIPVALVEKLVKIEVGKHATKARR